MVIKGMEQDEEYDRGHGPTEEQEREELKHTIQAHENGWTNMKLRFKREEALHRKGIYFHE